MPTLADQRAQLAQLFDLRHPADATSAYYALFHDPSRSSLWLHHDENGKLDGYAGLFRTGIDLFRPLLTMHCPTPEIAAHLIAEACIVGRPYLYFANQEQLALTGGSLDILSTRTLHLYQLDLAQFRTEINVLVRTATAPNGTPRAYIESNGVRAEAGVNWQTQHFGEVYVEVDPPARGKGWGRSVVMAVCSVLLASGRTPLYLVEPQNDASIALAESAGFQFTRERFVFAETTYRGHPSQHRTDLS
ncbi:MAG: hypothetical protein OHK0023_23140 [Anaerolineae bacterium]